MATSKNVLFALPLLLSIALTAPAPKPQAPPVASSYAKYDDFLAAWQAWGLAYVGQAPAGVAAVSIATSLTSSTPAASSNLYSIAPVASSSAPIPSAYLPPSTLSAYYVPPAHSSAPSSMLSIPSHTASPALTIVINQSSSPSSQLYTPPASTYTPPASTYTPASTYVPPAPAYTPPTTTTSGPPAYMTNMGNLLANIALQIGRASQSSIASVASSKSIESVSIASEWSTWVTGHVTPTPTQAIATVFASTTTAISTAIVKPSPSAAATTSAAHRSSCDDPRHMGAGCDSYSAPMLGIGAGFQYV